MRTKRAGPAGSRPMNAQSRTPVVGAITRRILGLGGFMCPNGGLARETMCPITLTYFEIQQPGLS
jgi:hypothetical protein